MTITIRPAVLADAHAISAVHIRARRQAYAGIMSPEALELMAAQATPRWWAARLHPAARLGWGLVAIDDGMGGGVGDAGRGEGARGGDGDGGRGGGSERVGDGDGGRGGGSERVGDGEGGRGGGTVVGFVFVGPSEEGLPDIGDLQALHVDPEHQGRGVGGRLHDAGLEILARQGFSSFVLFVLEGNERAIQFYLHRGWRPDGQRFRDVGGDFLRFVR